jgi:hypothetical protein
MSSELGMLGNTRVVVKIGGKNSSPESSSFNITLEN